MPVALSSLLTLAFGFGLLVLQSSAAVLVGSHAYAPNLMLPIALFLGVSPDVQLGRGAGMALVLGYFLDLFSGNRMGLATFLLVGTYIVVRAAGLRLMLRGPLFQVLLTFLVSLLIGGASLALRAVFEPAPPFEVGGALSTGLDLLGPAFVTALSAPLIFAPAQRIEALASRRREETRAATP